MKNSGKRVLILAAALVLLAGVPVFAEVTDYGAKGALEKSSPTIVQMLTYSLQDEYLARGEYELIMEKYGKVRPFDNIMAAEVQHIQWVVELFKKYGYPVPADTSREHVVLPPDMKTALQTGVQAEIDNIAMYESFLKQVNPELPADVRDVFERLKAASENHLNAFQNNLKRYK